MTKASESDLVPLSICFENDEIYLITRDYSNFLPKTIGVAKRITICDAIRLRSELDSAISDAQAAGCGESR